MKMTYEGVVYEGLSIDESLILTKRLRETKTTQSHKTEQPGVVSLISTTPRHKKKSKSFGDTWKPGEISFLLKNIGLRPSLLA
jgi:hypothetical protein